MTLGVLLPGLLDLRDGATHVLSVAGEVAARRYLSGIGNDIITKACSALPRSCTSAGTAQAPSRDGGA